MDTTKIVTVGSKQYRLVTSQRDGKWYANAVPVPPPDGRTYTLPQWTCEATSEAELNKKLDEHFEDLRTRDELN